LFKTLNSTDPVAGRSFSVDSRRIGSAWAEDSQDELTLPHPTVPMDGYVSEDSSLEESPENSESGHNTSVAKILSQVFHVLELLFESVLNTLVFFKLLSIC
jgi:hypothetical protein